MNTTWPQTCTDCPRDIYPRRWPVPHANKHQGRGLCGNCYQNQRRAGDFTVHQRRTLPTREVLAEWTHLRDAGVPHDQIAARLGIQRESLDRALQRAGVAE